MKANTTLNNVYIPLSDRKWGYRLRADHCLVQRYMQTLRTALGLAIPGHPLSDYQRLEFEYTFEQLMPRMYRGEDVTQEFVELGERLKKEAENIRAYNHDKRRWYAPLIDEVRKEVII